MKFYYFFGLILGYNGFVNALTKISQLKQNVQQKPDKPTHKVTTTTVVENDRRWVVIILVKFKNKQLCLKFSKQCDVLFHCLLFSICTCALIFFVSFYKY